MYIFNLNSVTEDRHIPKSAKPPIKAVLGFDGFAGVDVILDNGTNEKLLLFRGSVNKGASTFPTSWQTTKVSGYKMILAEVAMV